MMTRSRLLLAGAFAAILLSTSPAEEVWLRDNTRVYGLVSAIGENKTVVVTLPTGEEQKIPMEEIVAIRFLGRNPLLVQSGTQEFRFVNGGRIRGQILGNTGNVVQLDTAMAGAIHFDMSRIKGFVSLPLAGFSGRKAEELLECETPWVAGMVFDDMRDTGTHVLQPEAVRLTRSLDVVLDNRGSIYPGVIRRFELAGLSVDHELLPQTVWLRVLQLAGARLADAARDAVATWTGEVQMRIWGRDESRIQGNVQKISLGRWLFQPVWDLTDTLSLDLEEISLVQVLGGRVQYLSQVAPIEVNESTILSPPQPYRMDRSCQGDPISIAGKRYPWGIGQHADSEITFDLKGRFNEFRSDVGIATRMGDRGSVVFQVLGDGKEIYKSPLVRGVAFRAPGTAAAEGQAEAKPVEVKVSVQGVKKLTLKVTNGGDLDLGDVANWGSARVLR